MDLESWVDEMASSDWFVYIKRLSANDTGATGGNQVGVYVPKNVTRKVFPELDEGAHNPDVFFGASVDSDSVPEKKVRLVYYNHKKNEQRITQLKKGVKYTPLQDPEKTGAISVFAFNVECSGNSSLMRVWVCRNLEEEEYIQGRVGEIEPDGCYLEKGNVIFEGVESSRRIKVEEYPSLWNEKFPTGAEIISHIVDYGMHVGLSPDDRLIKRRNHEYDLFRLVERNHTLPLIRDGFDDMEIFMKLANSISNRRKSRSGRSLELHLEYIFKEEGVEEFGTQCTTEGRKRPDFLFPSCGAYHDASIPNERLAMLAVKTTVKDRWRQILNEAKRIESPYLFTLQQGVSENQFREMKDENVRLVVPLSLHESYPKSVRPQLLSLDQFIKQVSGLS